MPSIAVNGVTRMARSKKRRLWLDYLAYLAVRFVVAFAQMLSIEQSYALARFLGWVIYKVDSRHRQVGNRQPDSGIRRPVHRRRARPDRARSVSPFLHDAHGDPAHAAQASSRELASLDRAGRACPVDGPLDQRRPPAHRLDRPLRQLGARRLPFRNVWLSHRLGRPHARQSLSRALSPRVPRADRPIA